MSVQVLANLQHNVTGAEYAVACMGPGTRAAASVCHKPRVRAFRLKRLAAVGDSRWVRDEE